jgi:hypothetical protein
VKILPLHLPDAFIDLCPGAGEDNHHRHRQQDHGQAKRRKRLENRFEFVHLLPPNVMDLRN